MSVAFSVFVAPGAGGWGDKNRGCPASNRKPLRAAVHGPVNVRQGYLKVVP
jgi:hypothetical protein